MIVAFSIGDKSKAITNTIKKSADNIDFYSYPSIQDLVKEASLRHISFDRIVFSTSILRDIEGDLRELNDFIKNLSDSTEVVMIVNSTDSRSDKIFCSIFNSPMYTPVLLQKATPQNLLEIVRDDLLEVRAKYYVLDVKKDEAVISSSETEEPVSKEVNSEAPKKEKKGFLSKLMGGSKKNAQKIDSVSPQEEVEEPVSEPIKTVTDNGVDFGAGPRSVFTGFGGVEASEVGVVANEVQNIFTANQEPSSPLGVSDFEVNNSHVDDEDALLSVGDFGSQHSDTGFLDEDDEEELKQFAAQRNTTLSLEGTPSQEVFREEDSGEQAPPMVEDDYIPETPAKRVNQVVQPFVEKQEVLKSPNIDLVVGVKGSSVTQSIVDEAVKLVSTEGIKVLILDLDIYENGLLSFIDTEQFYIQGGEYGISKHRIYEEDGVGIASNGYGVTLTAKDVLRFLEGRLVKQYDMVFIDCPSNCLDLINIDILKMCSSVLVMTGSDRSDLVATTLSLTDRNIINLDVERFIMNNCNVEVARGESCNPEDISYIKKICLFANGCWVNNIE